jgi:NAD(P)-dependent dehydrogenase (short-subunit alcohol dehydrogenase family)
LIRLTSALGTIDGVRVNSVCPHTVATDAVRRSLETRTLEEIAPPPATLLGLEEVVAAVRQLIEDDSLSGRVTVLAGGESPRALDSG